MKGLFQRFLREESGADMVEYALVIALVAIVATAAVRTIGVTIVNAISNVTPILSNVL
jgi:pilus assembly protein Flp/PilA